jgi:hypothetical protein
MWYLVCSLFIIHSMGMLVDEFWFHHRRSLPRWERWGHPLDTLTVLICYLLSFTLAATARNLPVYILAAVVSTFFITKDEWVHAKVCTGGEMWLHACLFALHPILLIAIGLFTFKWGMQYTGYEFFRTFLIGQTILTLLFALYQIFYWNGPWKPALPNPS